MSEGRPPTGTRKVHEVKCHLQPFRAVLEGRKRHEVRKNDRNYAQGDKIILLEWNEQLKEYTGLMQRFIIGHVTAGPEWGLPEGLCVFTLLPWEADPWLTA